MSTGAVVRLPAFMKLWIVISSETSGPVAASSRAISSCLVMTAAPRGANRDNSRNCCCMIACSLALDSSISRQTQPPVGSPQGQYNHRDRFFNSRRDQIVTLAAHYKLPAIYEFREFTEAGGLMSYGTNLADVYSQAGNYVGKILKGAKPAELPVNQLTKFELVINLKVARTLGLTMPPGLISIVDDVIE